MEPVPEMEQLEEFRKSPVAVLRLQEPSLYATQHEITKPLNVRRSTDPTPHSPRSPLLPSSTMPYHPRNTSPYSRSGHLRSKSSTGSLVPPTMSRAQSLPGFPTASGHVLSSPRQRPASPQGSPSRARTPRRPVDEVFPGLPNRTLCGIGEQGSLIPQDDDISKATERSSSPSLGPPTSGSIGRIRRPASPLRYLAQANGSSTGPTTPSSAHSSPSLHSSRINDSFTNMNSYSGSLSYPGSFASSSVPSTPTSTRSRSPSISSLETIPDSPDAEEAALEAERIAQLKAAADAADNIEDSKSKADMTGSRGRSLGVGFGRDKRKRWSVCGAERRGDLNLDTIWED